MFELLELLVIGFGLLVIGSTMIWQRPLLAGSQTIFSNRFEIEDIIKEVIDKSKGNVLWGIAGELDPRFYGSIDSNLREVIEQHGAAVHFIAGPRIVVEDDAFKQYCDPGENEEYWKAHPFIKLAYDYPYQVKLFLLRQDLPREDSHCFCAESKDAPCITEKGHPELVHSPVLVEKGTQIGYHFHRKRFQTLINSKQAILWDLSGLNARKEFQKRCVSFSKMEQEGKEALRKLEGVLA